MIKTIALYLPQYHPTPDNDVWWGEGFTEWTNVAKAKRLYRGHYQPRIPANLGFYDLRIPEVREKQAELAKRAGVNAFCYYHYWFGNCKEELERPFKEVVASGKPDFPFCLCWANEPWYSKMWNKDGTIEMKLLVDQLYPGKKDNEQHFYSLLNAFKDERYFKIKGKLVFMIYKPLLFKECQEFITQWNELAIINGLPGFHFIGQTGSIADLYAIKDLGFNAVNLLRLTNFQMMNSSIAKRIVNYVTHELINYPYINDYKTNLKNLIGKEDSLPFVYPSLVPNWDHTPRSGKGGYLLSNSTPTLFYYHCRMVFDEIIEKDSDDQVVFLKSWNEWGEGNYMEPDIRFGEGYIEALSKALSVVYKQEG